MTSLLRKPLLLIILTLFLAGCATPEEKTAAYYAKGKYLYEKGHYNDAKLELKNALQIDPKCSDARYLLAMVALKQDDIRGAYSALLKTVADNPRHLKAQLELGRLYLAGRMPDKAMEQADTALQIDPQNDEARLFKVAAFLAQHDASKAQAILDNLKRQGRLSEDYYLLSASTAISRKDPQLAQTILNEGARRFPRSAAIQLFLASLYRQRGELPETEQAYQRIITLEPDKITHRFTLADFYWKTGRQPEAVRVLDAIPGTDEQKAIQVARYYQTKGRLDKAEQVLTNPFCKGIAARLALSEVYVGRGDMDKAVAVLTAYLKGHEKMTADAIQAKTALAALYLRKGAIVQAQSLADEVLSKSPKNTEAHFIKGQVYLLKGDSMDAVNELRSVVYENPLKNEAYVFLAQAQAAAGNPGQAEEALRSGVKYFPDSGPLTINLARLLAQRNKSDEAEALLREFVEQHPDNLPVSIALGDLYAAEGKTVLAERQFRSLVEKAPRAPLGYAGLAKLHLQAGRTGQAEDLLTKGVKQTGNTELMAQLVRLYIADKSYDKALALGEEHLRTNPNDAGVYLLLGHVYTARKTYGRAEEAYAKAAALAPHWEEPHRSLAYVYLVQGKRDEAIGKLTAYAKENPANPSPYLTMGQIHLLAGENRQAIDAYAKASAIAPEAWSILNDLAYLLSEYGTPPADVKRAQVLAAKALTLNPSAPAVLDTLGWINYKLGAFDRARTYLEKAAALVPDNPEVNFHLGMTLYRQGKPGEASPHIEQALKAKNFPGRAEAAATLKSIKG